MGKRSLIGWSAVLAAGLLAGCACGDMEEDGGMPVAESAPVNARMMGMDRAMAEPAAAKAAGVNGLTSGSFDAPEGQKMAYTATLTVQVRNVRNALMQARELVMKAGGYVKQLNDTSAVLAVPVAEAEKVLNKLTTLGIVSSLQISGENVTMQVADIGVRMENLEKSRQRLLTLLEKAGKVEEMVKVEEALTRVTTQLEQLQSQSKLLASRIDYVTMTLRCQAQAVQQVVPKETAPIEWVNGLGSDLLRPVKADLSGGEMPFDVTLPEGFVRAGYGRAVSAESSVLRFRVCPNAVTQTHWYGDDYAPLSFYLPMVRQTLKNLGGEIVEQERKMDGAEGRQFTVSPKLGGVAYVYTVAVFVDDDEVRIVEGWGRKAAFEKDLPEEAWQTLFEE